MNSGIQTRNMYRFEDVYFLRTNFVVQRSIKILQKKMKQIWKKYKDSDFPILFESKGVLYCGKWMSYNAANEIHLAPGQRDYLTLVHEMCHAMGCDNHDKKFVDLEFDILEEFFNINRGELELAAGLFGVDR
jgi:hypothetical protein